MSKVACAALVGIFAFVLYIPSLSSTFVYDAYVEIKGERFITDFSNLPQVLSLSVLKAKLMLGPRPGQMLYLMLIARGFGENPFGYHLFSNILHATNGILLFLLCQRLLRLGDYNNNKSKWVSLLACLAFVTHPLTVESVSEVSYSSVLLVMFFTLSGLLLIPAVDARYKGPFPNLVIALGWSFFSFGAITCKESGIEACIVFLAYTLLFDRNRDLVTKAIFMLPSISVAVAFLVLRLGLSPKDPHLPSVNAGYLEVAMINQPRLWLFMLLKIIHPVGLSADYTPQNWAWIPANVAWKVMIIWMVTQLFVAGSNRIFAFGAVIFWSNLIAVSNFFPLTRIVADRFYYLSLAGFLIQVVALSNNIKSPILNQVLSIVLMAALPLLCKASFLREKVFYNQMSLWKQTALVSPMSTSAHNGLGLALYEAGDIPHAIEEYFIALTLNPEMAEARDNLAVALMHEGMVNEASKQLLTVLYFWPDNWQAHANLGFIYSKEGRLNDAARELSISLKSQPREPQISKCYGETLLLKGDSAGALKAFEDSSKTVKDAEYFYNIGNALVEARRFREAADAYREAVKISPYSAEIYNNLANALCEQNYNNEAIIDYRHAINLNPNFGDAYDNLGDLLLKMGSADEAVSLLKKAAFLKPFDVGVQSDLKKAEYSLRASEEAKPSRNSD